MVTAMGYSGFGAEGTERDLIDSSKHIIAAVQEGALCTALHHTSLCGLAQSCLGETFGGSVRSEDNGLGMVHVLVRVCARGKWVAGDGCCAASASALAMRRSYALLGGF